MKNKILKNIVTNNLIEKNDIVIVGVSGGHDSVSLLHVLHSLSNYLSIKLIGVHINHNLRGLESDEDENYVKKLCQDMGVKFYKEKFDVSEIAKTRKVSIEVAARDIRYSYFEKISIEEKAKKIAVAHNKNDQAETIVMNIIRGTGLEGLIGMEFKCKNLIRPILNIERSEIEKYCLDNSIHPRIDKTNLESIYTRNKVRLDLIPKIEKMFSTNITNSICRMSSILKDDKELINEIVEKNEEIYKFDKSNSEIIIETSKFNQLHMSIKRRIVRKSIQILKHNLTNIQNVHVEKVVELIHIGKVGKILHLPQNIRVIKDYNTVKITTDMKKIEPIKFNVSLKIPGETIIEKVGVIETYLEKRIKNVEQSNKVMYNSLVQLFDYDKIGEDIVIRNRLEGDIFKPYKSKGTKKIKKYFIDEKIPKEERDKVPLLACDSEVIWIVGNIINDNAKVDESTKNILRVKFIPFCEQI